jgi:hypothetical protein
MIHAILVAHLISFTPSGSVPFQPGPVTAKFPALSAVARVPGEAKTFVHASSIGIGRLRLWSFRVT